MVVWVTWIRICQAKDMIRVSASKSITAQLVMKVGTGCHGSNNPLKE